MTHSQKWIVRTPHGDLHADSISMLADWMRIGRVQNAHYVWHPVLQRWLYVRELEELKGLDLSPASYWVVFLNGVDHRPRDLDELQKWRGEGRIPDQAMIYHPGQKGWMSAGSVPELADVQKPQFVASPLSQPERLSSDGTSTIWMVALVVLVVGFLIFSLLSSDKAESAAPPSPPSASIETATIPSVAPAPAPEPVLREELATEQVTVSWDLRSTSSPRDRGKRDIPVRGTKGCLAHWRVASIAWSADATNSNRVAGVMAGRPLTDLSIVVKKGAGLPGVPALQPGVVHPTLVIHGVRGDQTVIRLYPERRGGNAFPVDTRMPKFWRHLELACD
jgi:hypothetical protein